MPRNGPFLRTRLRRLGHRLRGGLSSPGQSLMAAVVVVGIAGALYAMWRAGLYYMALMPWLEMLFFPNVYAVFCLFLFVLSFVASLVLHNNGLFHAGEAELLLYLPIAPSRAALYRSVELCLLNAAGALLLIAPLVVASATVQVPPGYPPVRAMRGAWLLVVLLPPFLVIPSVLGAVVIVALRRFARGVPLGLAGGIAAVILVAALSQVSWGVRTELFATDLPPGRMVRLLSDALAPAHAWFLPSHWLAEALFGPARGVWYDTLWFGGLLLSTASVCLVVWVATLRRWYYAAWLAADVSDSAAAESAPRPNRMRQWHLSLRARLGRLHTLMLKDTILFARNRLLLTQSAVLVGPLLLYFLALRSLYGSIGEDPWFTLLIGATNVAALAVILCAIGCRFLMPLVGIDRLKFWLLRMAPPRLGHVLLQKCLFGTVVLLAIGQPLIALSNHMTSIDRVFVWTSHLGLLVLAPVISTICIGMGALFPEFAADAGHRALNGMAAAAALVLSLLSAACLLGGAALAYVPFLYRGGASVEAATAWTWLTEPAFLGLLRRNVALGAAAGIVMAATLLGLGHARLRRLEIP